MAIKIIDTKYYRHRFKLLIALVTVQIVMGIIILFGYIVLPVYVPELNDIKGLFVYINELSKYRILSSEVDIDDTYSTYGKDSNSKKEDMRRTVTVLENVYIYNVSTKEINTISIPVNEIVAIDSIVINGKKCLWKSTNNSYIKMVNIDLPMHVRPWEDTIKVLISAKYKSLKAQILPPTITNDLFYQFINYKVTISRKNEKEYILPGSVIVNVKSDDIYKTTWAVKNKFITAIVVGDYKLREERLIHGCNVKTYIENDETVDSMAVNDKMKIVCDDIYKIFDLYFNNYGKLVVPSDSITYGTISIVFKASKEAYSNAGVIILPISSIYNYGENNITVVGGIAHELSHCWWGGVVRGTLTGDKIINSSTTWLQEGFANYSELYAIEQLYGKTINKQYIDNILNALENEGNGPRDPLKIKNINNESNLGKAYAVAFMLKTLRAYLGDESFNSMGKYIVETYRYRWLTEMELGYVINKYANRESKWFVDMLFKTGDYARCDYDIKCDSIVENKGQYITYLNISNDEYIKNKRKYKRNTDMPDIMTKVLLTTENDETVIDVLIKDRICNYYVIKSIGRPKGIVLDPYKDLVGVDWNYKNNYINQIEKEGDVK